MKREIDATAGRPIDVPDLTVANSHVHDRAALDALWQRDGYLFFRDVLDRDAIDQARRGVMAALVARGVIDDDAVEPVWNGRNLADLPAKLPELYVSGIWQELVKTPALATVVDRVVGCPAVSVPLTGYRTAPPGAGASADPFAMAHQDGVINGDVHFWTWWIPLTEIDREMGGLALAEGMHAGGYFDGLFHEFDASERYPERDGAIPRSSWRSAHFRPGDALFFHVRTPHAGLPNLSAKFRLSIDVRFWPTIYPNQSIIGNLVSITPERALVEEEGGRRRNVPFGPDVYFRGNSGKRLTYEEVQPFIPPGTLIWLGVEGETAHFLQPAS